MPVNDDNYEYPFDPTGQATTNLIENEEHTIPPEGWRNVPREDWHFDYFFVIPFKSPFFRDNLKVTHYPSGQELHDGVDFVLSYKYIDASYQTGRSIYGAISFYNTQLSGTLEITYQTLGGKWAIDENKALEMVTEAIYNPRITSWEQVVDVPGTFPIINHEHDLKDMVGMESVVDKLTEIAQLINQQTDNNSFRTARQEVYQGERRDRTQWQLLGYAEYDDTDITFSDKRVSFLLSGCQNRTDPIMAHALVSVTYDTVGSNWIIEQRELTETFSGVIGVVKNEDPVEDDANPRIELWVELPNNTGRYSLTVLTRQTPFSFQMITHSLISGEPLGFIKGNVRSFHGDLVNITDTLTSLYESGRDKIKEIALFQTSW